MTEKMRCKVCGYEFTTPPDFCPKCLTKVENHTHDEIWKDPKYLAGLFDGEGSFFAYPFFDRKTGLWYLSHSFSIKMLATTEWMETAEYLKTMYGGSTIRANHRKFYFYTLRRTEDLLRFLDDFIPLLHIKREDAIKLSKSLLNYKKIVDTGRTTEEEWRQWLEAHEILPRRTTPPLSIS